MSVFLWRIYTRLAKFQWLWLKKNMIARAKCEQSKLSLKTSRTVFKSEVESRCKCILRLKHLWRSSHKRKVHWKYKIERKIRKFSANFLYSIKLHRPATQISQDSVNKSNRGGFAFKLIVTPGHDELAKMTAAWEKYTINFWIDYGLFLSRRRSKNIART